MFLTKGDNLDTSECSFEQLVNMMNVLVSESHKTHGSTKRFTRRDRGCQSSELYHNDLGNVYWK